MAAKKYYAVKKGRTTGIFTTWEECRASVEGYAGASFRGFADLPQARAYLEEGTGKNKPKASQNSLLAYVDGSYDDSLKKYAFGCVFLLSDGRIYTEYGNGCNQDSLKHRNVTGEMLGAMYAVRFAMENGFEALEIRYDYEGIEKWVTGEWKAKTELTAKYAQTMRLWSSRICLHFTKVAAHANVRYNELADSLAKQGLIQGDGIPKIRRIVEMEPYEERDSTE